MKLLILKLLNGRRKMLMGKMLKIRMGKMLKLNSMIYLQSQQLFLVKKYTQKISMFLENLLFFQNIQL